MPYIPDGSGPTVDEVRKNPEKYQELINEMRQLIAQLAEQYNNFDDKVIAAIQQAKRRGRPI